MAWVFLNDHFLPADQAVIPVADRGFLFGDGAFTTIRISQGRPEFLKAHLQRLYQSCRMLNIDQPLIKEEWILELVERNQALEGVWRLKLISTGGADAAGLHLPRRAGHFLMTLKPYQLPAVSPCRLCLYPDPIYRPFSSIKSLAYLDRLHVSHYAHERGFDEAIVRTGEGYIVETAFSNLFWIKDHLIGIPDPKLPYLKGIFLTEVIERLPCEFQLFKGGIEDVPTGASIYICNSLSHIRPVLEIDRQDFPRSLEWEAKIKQFLVNCLAGA